MKPKVTTDFQHGKATIFKSPFLEKLTKTTPRSNIIVYGIAITIMIYIAIDLIELTVIQVCGLFIFGVLFWTLAEYLLHRFVFHWINEAKWSQRIHFIMHGNHHNFPSDEERLLMPPIPGLIMGGVLFAVFYCIFWLLGISQLNFGFFPGFFSGYLMYSFVHRATHISRPPKHFKHIWYHHSLHHYKYPDKAFGVSSPFWDKVFGTMPPKN